MSETLSWSGILLRLALGPHEPALFTLLAARGFKLRAAASNFAGR
jgi:hypothetical protein